MSNAEQTQTAGELAVQNTSTDITTARVSTEFKPESMDMAESLPSLDGRKEHPAPLSVEYWSPEAAGEFKDVYVFGVAMAQIQDMETKTPKLAECAFFVEKKDGKILRWYTASVKLVGDIKSAIERGEIGLPDKENGILPDAVRITLSEIKKLPNKHHMNIWTITRLI